MAACFIYLCFQPHKTVLEKHPKPDDVLPGIKNRKDPLPHVPLSGMYNKSGGKVRLTFKLEQDQLWIGTKGRTSALTLVWPRHRENRVFGC